MCEGVSTTGRSRLVVLSVDGAIGSIYEVDFAIAVVVGEPEVDGLD